MEAGPHPGGPGDANIATAVDMPVPDDDIEMPDTMIMQNKATLKGNQGKELDAKYVLRRRRVGEVPDRGRQTVEGPHRHGRRQNRPPGGSRPGAARAHPAGTVEVRQDELDKSKDPREVEAKSRWVVAGHLSPKDGTRTDAPVAPQVALYLLFSLAANFDWPLGTFDVSDAFPTGKKNERKLYVRPPREGIRGVPNGSLLELVKGVFGFPESPRLWWLEMRGCILKAGF